MNLLSIGRYFRAILPELLLVILIAGLWLLARNYNSFQQDKDTAEVDPHQNMPRETRYRGLDYFSATNLRLPAYEGVKTIEIGSLLLRRKKTGFIRLGAYNEALISDVRIVLDAKAFGLKPAIPILATNTASRTEPALPNPGKPVAPAMAGRPPGRPVREEVNGGKVPKNEISDTLQQIFKNVIAGLSAQNQKISGLTIHNIGIDVTDEVGSSWTLLRADEASLVATPSHRGLRFQGNVVMGNTQGDRLACERTSLILGNSPQIVALHGKIQSQNVIHPFEKIAFTFLQWIQGNGHSWMDSPSPEVKPGQGRHTPPHRIRIP